MKRILLSVIVAVIGSLAVCGPSMAATTFSSKMDSLGELVILSLLFSRNSGGDGVLMSSDNSLDLGNLIMLDQLFNDSSHRVFGGAHNTSIGELLILNQLMKNSNILGVNNNNNTLGTLFILDRLFANDNGSFLNAIPAPSAPVKAKPPIKPTPSASSTLSTASSTSSTNK